MLSRACFSYAEVRSKTRLCQVSSSELNKLELFFYGMALGGNHSGLCRMAIYDYAWI